MKRRVLVIGVDSFSMDLILKWREYLPNLNRMIEQGTYGYMRSTVPPFTPPAWTAILTGKNPGKTGIFDWITYPQRKDEKIRVVYSYDIKAETVFDILSKNGKKVVSLNVPLTYPPWKVNGYMVSGIPTPVKENAVITYPESLKDELDEIVSGYQIQPMVNLQIKGKEEEYIEEFSKTLVKRFEAALYLLHMIDWDLFFLVFFAIDSVQHYFWHHMDENHPLHNPNNKYKDVIKNFYIQIDSLIGKILSEIPENTYTFVISDHGMGPLYGYFLVNEFLLRYGFFKVKNHSYEVKEVQLKVGGVFLPVLKENKIVLDRVVYMTE